MVELALLVALPILAAGLAVGLWYRWGSARRLTLATLTAQTALAAWATRQAAGGATSDVLGGYEAPFGIEIGMDGVTGLVALLVAAVGLVVVAAVRRDAREHPFYALVLLLVAGLTGVSLARDVFNLYVFLEISGLAVYGLVASGRGARGALAGLKYLFIGTVGATLYLLGVGYLYVATGTLNMADLAGQIAEVGYTDPLVLAGFGLAVVGLGVKVAIFPLHVWQPDAYADAPDDVTALMGALMSTTAAYAMLRVLFAVFTVDALTALPRARTALIAAIAVSVLAGGLFALRQTRVKRMLAYSSISQFGLVALGLLVATDAALTGAVIHLVGHAVIKAGLFLGVGVVAVTVGARTVDEYAGLADRAPWLSAGVAVLGLALVGVPPAVGFAGKWYLALGALRAGRWGVLAVVLASTLVTLAYVARLVERMYVAEPAGEPAKAPAAGEETLLPLAQRAAPVLALAAAAVALGLAAPVLDGVTQPAIEVFLDP
jgi:multicomponent Na+:H+ antiporter subunit D